MKFISVIGFVLHYLILLPSKLMIAVVTAVKILSFIGIDSLQKWASILDTKALGPYVGFKDGMTPISSWQNFGLYSLMLGLGCLVMLPHIVILGIKCENLKHPNEKLAIRLRIGKLLKIYKNIASALLFTIILLTVFDFLTIPFPFGLKGVVLLCLGVIFGIDNLKYSSDGEKYGIAPLPFGGKTRAIEYLAEELGIDKKDIKLY